MAFPQRQDEYYTYADLLSWDTDVRYELYDGCPVALASPTTLHQEIVFELGGHLREFLKDKPCKASPAPLDVRLFQEAGDRPEDVDTVVQPDLMVVCDRDKLDKTGVRGAPDLIVEVLSPATARYDRIVKFNLYRRAGVREYWIVDPEARAVHTFLLENGNYIAKVFPAPQKVPSGCFEGLEIDLGPIFGEESSVETE